MEFPFGRYERIITQDLTHLCIWTESDNYVLLPFQLCLLPSVTWALLPVSSPGRFCQSTAMSDSGLINQPNESNWVTRIWQDLFSCLFSYAFFHPSRKPRAQWRHMEAGSVNWQPWTILAWSPNQMKKDQNLTILFLLSFQLCFLPPIT